MAPTRREKEFKRLNEMPWGELQKLAKVRMRVGGDSPGMLTGVDFP